MAIASISRKPTPSAVQLRMKMAASGPVSNNSVWRWPPAFETSLKPKPRFAQSSASPEITRAPLSTTLANSDTATSIKSVAVLSAGHVLEGDTIGFKGTPLDERRYSNERLASVFEISKDIAQHMERLGYDILWSAEHHFQREGYECIPNLSTWGVYLAQHTKRLKFGCAFNVLTMWHPIRLAEDFAVADILTNGRMIFGIGRGYHTREVETFGAPMLDDADNRERFEA